MRSSTIILAGISILLGCGRSSPPKQAQVANIRKIDNEAKDAKAKPARKETETSPSLRVEDIPDLLRALEYKDRHRLTTFQIQALIGAQEATSGVDQKRGDRNIITQEHWTSRVSEQEIRKQIVAIGPKGGPILARCAFDPHIFSHARNILTRNWVVYGPSLLNAALLDKHPDKWPCVACLYRYSKPRFGILRSRIPGLAQETEIMLGSLKKGLLFESLSGYRKAETRSLRESLDEIHRLMKEEYLSHHLFHDFNYSREPRSYSYPYSVESELSSLKRFDIRNNPEVSDLLWHLESRLRMKQDEKKLDYRDDDYRFGSVLYAARIHVENDPESYLVDRLLKGINRPAVVEAMQILGSVRPPTLSLLLEIFQDPRAGDLTRSSVCRVLEKNAAYHPEAIPVILEEIKEKKEKAHIPQLSPYKEHLKPHARTIGSLFEDIPPGYVSTYLGDALREIGVWKAHKNRYLAIAGGPERNDVNILRILKSIGPAIGPEALPILEKMIRKPDDPLWKVVAVQVLPEMGPAAKPYIPVVHEYIQENIRKRNSFDILNGGRALFRLEGPSQTLFDYLKHYHSDLDLSELDEFLLEMNPDYAFHGTFLDRKP